MTLDPLEFQVLDLKFQIFFLPFKLQKQNKTDKKQKQEKNTSTHNFVLCELMITGTVLLILHMIMCLEYGYLQV